ncbi:MAG: prepilin-type N-terminal cleavage/methylation domain-containing protein [Nitrospirota bacterium]|nr:prepilin-type N-terminal cleavage/methylation domain-containing protein [Nitrospirota bacterium]
MKKSCACGIKISTKMTPSPYPSHPRPRSTKRGRQGRGSSPLSWWERVRVRGNSRSGFTLLELIISIALIGIIVLIIAGTMRLGFRSVDSGEKKIESLERIRASLNIIDSQIQSEIPLTYDDEGVRKYYFIGERKFMQFTTNCSIWGGESGYVTVTYKVESGDNGRQVLYASENIVGMEGKRDTKLFDSFEMIYFEYFYKDPTEEEGEWVEQWKEDAGIPEKVKVHLVEGTRDLSIIIPFRARGSLTQTPGAVSSGKFIGP